MKTPSIPEPVIPDEFYLVIAAFNDARDKATPYLFEAPLHRTKADVWEHLEALTDGRWPRLTYTVMLVEAGRLVDVTEKFQFEERWDSERGSYVERADVA